MTTEQLATIKAGITDGVVRLTLTRPAQRNPLNVEVSREISYAVKKYAYRSDAKVLILGGEGRSFSAGHDLKVPWQGTTARDRLLEYSRYQQMFVDIETAPVVKIAQVQGHAVGAGLVLPTLCELRYGSTDSSLRLSELDLGAPFSMGGFPRLARLIGLTRASDLLLTGRAMGAEEALAGGFFTEVVDHDRLADRVTEVATAVARRSSLVLMESTRQIRETADEIVSGQRNELVALMAAHLDPESRASGAEYGARFAAPATQ
ncbi:enoyl-CoA hydratase/isomerase family protein [Amycolatopsis rhabdoformis]|uniref:Enoyl-CoA hydratase/isomerase family protein n=1 Tax=Amycolatopsis rhabdoformis TaxID=1448059 RepID=A0ABZ1IMH7_9PSEU|nr:enoyl-CoA hydratase/isomerase family protein [Amycolatopsis rhabdoformis]WSE34744.1 enoyl-CoA hydratase/isomerase family protein [Amycolatopsis rhabdoformis]